MYFSIFNFVTQSYCMVAISQLSVSFTIPSYTNIHLPDNSK